MSRNFLLIRSKVRMSNISGVRRKFLGAICKGYMIKAPTSQEDFYTVSNSPNKILVSVEVITVAP